MRGDNGVIDKDLEVNPSHCAPTVHKMQGQGKTDMKRGPITVPENKQP